MKNFTLSLLLILSAATALHSQLPYSQNFGTVPPTGWTNVDNTGTGAGTWKKSTASRAFFTTRSTGYAIFDSDALGNDGKPENASLTSKAIDCSGHSHVAIEFQSWFQQYQSGEGSFYVSNDNSNWQQFFVVNTTSDNPETIKLDISAVAANSATVYLRFTWVGDNDYWWAIDDLKVYEPAELDLSVVKIDNAKYVGLSDQQITGTVVNSGTTPITSFTLSYIDNAGTPVSQNFTGLNLGLFETFNFVMSQKLTMPTSGLHAVTVVASNPNFGVDLVATNDSAKTEITALSAFPDKNVLFEEFTTNQCGWCPAGHYIASQIEASSPYFIPVNVHEGFGDDAMTIPEAAVLATAFANGAPTANIDRVYYKGQEKVGISRGLWQSKVTERHGQPTPAAIDAVSTFDPGTRALNVTVTAKFFGPVNGTFRVNCYVVEDSVSKILPGGVGNGYDQTNYLSGYSPFSSYPAYSMPDPVPGYMHRHVQRQVFGGTWGSTGIVPATTGDNGAYTETYTTTLNSSWDASKCKLVAFVHEYNANTRSGKNEVLNVVALPLNGSVSQNSTPSVYVTGIEEAANPVGNISIYPNPVADVATLEFNLKSESKVGFNITDMLGQVVYSEPEVTLNKGGFKSAINTSDFSNGVYFVSVKNNGKATQTLKFVVSK